MAAAAPPTEESVYSDSSHDSTMKPDLRFIHYNDVYHVEAGSREPVGGMARFQHVCNYYRNDKAFEGQPGLLTFFSGDVYNPSLESSVTKGSHMVPVLNSLRTDVACVGNHDLDFGVPQFEHLAKECKFPWLIANVLDPALGDDVPIGHAKKTQLLTASNGIKVGLIGLGEREWLDTVNALPPNLIYKSASATAIELAPKLREQGADVVIALTHAREPNDIKLAERVPPGTLDMILGGHDHTYEHRVRNGCHVMRSGTDFKNLSYIKAWRKNNGEKGWVFNVTRRNITREIPEDAEAQALVTKLTASLKAKLEKPIGYAAAPLDARFSTVRLKESNIGNFVCDLMRLHYQADCALMAGGTIRGDQIYPPGILRLGDILNCFPFEDPVVVLRLSGQDIWDAIENGVSTYPALEGRFPQVSNIHYAFNPQARPGSRLISLKLKGEPIDLKQSYTMSTRGYMAHGKDGYTSLQAISEGGTAEEVVDEENGILISMILRQYFMSMKVLGRWKRLGNSMNQHWDKVHTDLHEIHPVKVSPAPTPIDGDQGAEFPFDPHSTSAIDDREGDVMDRLNGQHPRKRRRTTVVEGHVVDSDSEDDDQHLKPHRSNAFLKPPETVPRNRQQRLSQHEEKSRRLSIMRRVSRKWWRLTGMPGHPNLVNEEREFNVVWTKGIAPQVEGRIQIVTGEAVSPST